MSLATVTRASLGLRAKQRANLEYSNFISPDELNQLVETSLAKLYNMLVGFYEDYFVKRENIQLVANQADYALPPNYMKLRQVYYRDTNGGEFLMSRYEISDITNFTNSTYAYGTWPVGYCIEDMRLVVYPRPQGNPTSLLVRYIPQYTPAVSDDQQIKLQFANGWDEWVVNDVAIQIRNKAMMPAQELVQERAILEARLLHEAKNRNAGDAPKVRDTGFTGSRGRRNRFGWGGY